jgi:hypothetical protein
MSNKNEETSENSQKKNIFADFWENKEIKEAAINVAIKEGTYAIKKYKKTRGIVEEGILYLHIILDINDKYHPLVEVQVDDLLLGYINEKKKTNEETFKVECYKRGSGKWDKHTVRVTPIGNHSIYFKPGCRTSRFAPTPKNSKKSVTVHIPIKHRRNWWGAVKQP